MKSTKHLVFIYLAFYSSLSFSFDSEGSNSFNKKINKITLCFEGQDCINENIINDTNNIVDLVQIVDKFTGDYIKEKQTLHTYLWEYKNLIAADEFVQLQPF
jgi:hypothetical protein